MNDQTAVEPFTFFISYRRKDTAPIALLLKNELEKRLRFVRVFVDVEAIDLGEPFPERITGLIKAAHATIVLIGQHWMPLRLDGVEHVTGSEESSLLSRPASTDWVIEEIEQSFAIPIAYTGADAYGLSTRLVIPLFINCPQSFRQFTVPNAILPLTKLNADSIEYTNWPSAIGPLLGRIAKQVNIQSRPDSDLYPRANPAKARTQSLSDVELGKILKYDDYDGWYLDNYGHSDVMYLVKNFKFADFKQAAAFMQQAAEQCTLLDHHPEWRNVYNYVTVALTTWDACRSVTIYDLNLALLLNKMATRIVSV